MMYVVFMKNFLLVDSSEWMAVRLTSASWAQKRLRLTSASWAQKLFDSYFVDMMHDEFMKNFLSRQFERSDGCKIHFGLLCPKKRLFMIYYFVDMMCVGFMKNFLLADSSELMAVRLISAS